jgi:hypothetical protein
VQSSELLPLVVRKKTDVSEKRSLPPVSAGFLLGVYFGAEYGGYMFLRNAGLFPNYAELDARGMHTFWLPP